MAGYTLAQAQANFDAAQIAYNAALSNQSYSIASRTMQRQQLQVLSDEMDKWSNMIDRLSGNARGRARNAVL